MFGSTILDVAVGVVFGFLAISLFTSAAVEAINSYLKLRAVNLKSGIMALVNDPTFTGLAKKLYEHGSISPFGPGTAADTYQNKKELPSYIDKAQFARALMDVTGLSAASPAAAAQAPGPSAIAAFNDQVAAISDPQIRDLVAGVVNRTSGDVKKIETEIGEWFDNSMDRLSGTFKRWTQLATFVIALVFAFAVNLDSLRVATQIWQHPAIAEGLKIPDITLLGANTDQEAISKISTIFQGDFPIGWAANHFLEVSDGKNGWLTLSQSPVSFISPVIGWIITAFAALFGAPFWFDTLQSLIRLKGAGPSPAEKQGKTAAAN
jgi:hypothetical protein